MTMNLDLSIRSKVILTLGVPATCLLLYWLLRNQDEEDDDEDQQRVTTSRQTVIEVMVPSKAVGPLIGRQGANIKKLQNQTGTMICFRDDSKRDSGEDRVLVIRGSTDQAQEAELLVRKTINEMPTLLTEEIQVPVKALGRIIGRNGDSIRQISRSSNARVYIDRAREEPRDITKKVSIIGSREQIDIAKSLIEEKVDEEEIFRAKAAVIAANREQRNKQASGSIRRTGHVLTNAEKHSNDQEGIPTNPSSPQKHVSLTTHVKEWPNKEYIEVYVSSVADPQHFWVQIISTNAIHLDELVQRMSSLYNTDHYKNLSDDQYLVGDFVAALYEQDNSWYRARVMGIEGSQLDLYFLDYGDSGYSHISNVRLLRDDFLLLPFQAVQCCLAQVKAKGEDWTEDDVNHFEDITYAAKWKVLMAKRIGTKCEGDGETTQIVQLIDTNSPVDIHVSHEMVQSGFAEWDIK
ncbi:tudor and KH domain-containing protein-like [Mizuhopecten yessoensis]|uniref:Tudor and KH domain-containing protein n=1 Tax=Mizuhopecten yessoensis TaxID=6573 RepID=A0A210PIR7_MIZYE|nr:tudor and KH domain-containing protein-like [Mizuhopecten yessoensis]OWF36372.1 Tudor and KH domain-containing protein [Mizuhopecten yessoensis]